VSWDDEDWSLTSSSYPDHTGNQGQYATISFTDPNFVAVLESSISVPGRESFCLSFWYHMDSMHGHLEVTHCYITNESCNHFVLCSLNS
jgi:hypothetical protein